MQRRYTLLLHLQESRNSVATVRKASSATTLMRRPVLVLDLKMHTQHLTFIAAIQLTDTRYSYLKTTWLLVIYLFKSFANTEAKEKYVFCIDAGTKAEEIKTKV